MAIHTTCPTHPDMTPAQTLDEALAHVRDHHPDERTDDALAAMTSSVVRARPDRRIFRCRRCATVVDTYDPDPPPYCEACR